MKVMSSFNRNKPLFERKSVPCEFFQCSDENRNIFCERGSQRRKVKFTLRLLQGHRCISNGNQTTERVIRLEISDEYRKCENHNLIPSEKHLEGQLGHSSFRNPSNSSSGSSNSALSSIRFPVLQDRSNFHSKDIKRDDAVSIDRYDDGAAMNDKTPVNVYELEVGETDFAKLQQDQALLVDFGNFSRSIIDLLNLCDLGDHEDVQSDKSVNLQCESYQNLNGSSFFCRIEDFSSANSCQTPNLLNSACKGSKALARFSIVESNQFRELIHLSLNIQPGTDMSVRAYLSERLSDLLAKTNMMNFQLRCEKDRAIAAEKMCAEMTQQYHEMIQMSETEKNDLVQKADASIQKENVKRCEELQLIKRMNEEEINNLKEANKEIRNSLQKQIESYDSENRQLLLSLEDKEKKLQMVEKLLSESKSNEDNALTSKIRIESELSMISKDHCRLSDELENVKNYLSNLEYSNSELQKKLRQSAEDLHESKQELVLLRKQSDDKIQKLAHLEHEMVKFKSENDQAKEILTRYQRDRLEMKRKLKEKSERINTLEEITFAKEKVDIEMNKRLEEKEIKIEKLEKELQESTSAFEKVLKDLDEKQKTLNSNQQVIAWLNKEAKVKSVYSQMPTAIMGAKHFNNCYNRDHAVPISVVNGNISNQLSPVKYITPESLKGHTTLSQVQPKTSQSNHLPRRDANVPVYIKNTPMKMKAFHQQPERPQSSSSVMSLPRRNTPPVAIPQPNKISYVPPTV